MTTNEEYEEKIAQLQWQLDDCRKGFGELDEKYGTMLKHDCATVKYIKQLHTQIAGLELRWIMHTKE